MTVRILTGDCRDVLRDAAGRERALRGDEPAVLGTARLRRCGPDRAGNDAGNTLRQWSACSRKCGGCCARTGRHGLTWAIVTQRAMAGGRQMHLSNSTCGSDAYAKQHEPDALGMSGCKAVALPTASQAERPDRHPVARRLRAAGRWLVSAPGHHLVEAEPDAGERHRPLHQGARVPVPAEQERAVLLRCGGDCGAGIGHHRLFTI